MAKMIQLRNVSDSLHRQLKARAAMEGLSLSDFLIREARKVAAHPSVEQIRERLEARPATALKTSPTRALRAERNQR